MGSRQEMDPFSIYQCLFWASSSSYSLRYPHKSQGKSLFEEEQISWQCKKAAYRPKKISTDKLCSNKKVVGDLRKSSFCGVVGA